MRLIIDRIEGEWAFIENEEGNIFKMAIQLLPKDCKESDALMIKKDEEYTHSRQTRIKKLMDDVWE